MGLYELALYFPKLQGLILTLHLTHISSLSASSPVSSEPLDIDSHAVVMEFTPPSFRDGFQVTDFWQHGAFQFLHFVTYAGCRGTCRGTSAGLPKGTPLNSLEIFPCYSPFGFCYLRGSWLVSVKFQIFCKCSRVYSAYLRATGWGSWIALDSSNLACHPTTWHVQDRYYPPCLSNLRQPSLFGNLQMSVPFPWPRGSSMRQSFRCGMLSNARWDQSRCK